MKVVLEAELNQLVDEILDNAENLSYAQVKRLWAMLLDYIPTHELSDALLARLNSSKTVEQRLRFSPAISKAEAKVLPLLCKGLSNSEIAREIGRNPRTVESHVSSMLRKTGMRSRSEVISWALRENII